MDDFPVYASGGHAGGHGLGHRREHDSDSDIQQFREDLVRDLEKPSQIVMFAPEERFRLGYLDVMCLVMNRMIGELVVGRVLGS